MVGVGRAATQFGTTTAPGTCDQLFFMLDFGVKVGTVTQSTHAASVYHGSGRASTLHNHDDRRMDSEQSRVRVASKKSGGFSSILHALARSSQCSSSLRRSATRKRCNSHTKSNHATNDTLRSGNWVRLSLQYPISSSFSVPGTYRVQLYRVQLYHASDRERQLGFRARPRATRVNHLPILRLPSVSGAGLELRAAEHGRSDRRRTQRSGGGGNEGMEGNEEGGVVLRDPAVRREEIEDSSEEEEKEGHGGGASQGGRRSGRVTVLLNLT
eukprot:898964-Rhodomonas_salina.2